MTIPSPTEAIETALYTKLTAATGLVSALGGTAIYNKRATQGVGAKYVVFQWHGGGDTNDTAHRHRDLVYYVSGVASTQSAAAAIDTQLDAALHKQELTITGYTHLWTGRENDINFVSDDTAGVAKYHVGGLYRIIIDGGI